MMRGAITRVVVLLLAAGQALAEEPERGWLELGPRVLIVTAGGEPTNDMTGYGIQATVRLRPHWRLGFGLDSMGGDFEVPNEVVQIATPEVFDSSVDMLVLSAWVERQHGRWFWTAGLGFASPDADDLTGPTLDGSTFDLTTDPGTETILSGTGGLRFSLGRRLTSEIALRVDHHLADWKVQDRVSGKTGSIEDYTAYGVHAGLSWRF